MKVEIISYDFNINPEYKKMIRLEAETIYDEKGLWLNYSEGVKANTLTFLKVEFKDVKELKQYLKMIKAGI